MKEKQENVELLFFVFRYILNLCVDLPIRINSLHLNVNRKYSIQRS